MKRKKSQVTLFIIVGIVIVVIVSLIYGASRYAGRQETETAVKKVREAKLNVQPITTYVESCLDRYAKEALVTLGQQGGKILASEGGTLSSFNGIQDGDYKVPYYIYPANPHIVLNYPWPNLKTYPYPGGAPDGDLNAAEDLNGIFGESNMPPLTKGSGPHSLQLQIETNTLRRIGDCNLQAFENQFDIVKGTPSLETTIAKGNVIFDLTYPLEIADIATGAKTTIEGFQASVRIRIGRIYEFARYLVLNDIKDPEFDVRLMVEDMTVDVKDKGGNDIITIMDARFTLTGSPYEFKFARYNRKPALHYIDPSQVPSFNPGDRIFPENISADPKAYDPDEVLPAIDFKVNGMPLGASKPIDALLICQRNEAIVTVCAIDAEDSTMQDCQEFDIKEKITCT